jgi:hypothetical protein
MMMRFPQAVFILLLALSQASGYAVEDPLLSTDRQPDSTAKTLADIRAAEKRHIPLEVMLKTSNDYKAGGPVGVTIMITNLFDAPLVINRRMLVNHPLLQGEVSFRIIDPNGKKVNIQRLITPLSLRDEDFVTLNRGESMQRDVDLTDLFGITQKGVYTIQVSYHNDIDHVGETQHAWKGIVWSDPIELILN